MTNLFYTVLNMSITSAIVIILVIIARMLIKRLPKKYSYLLWSVVAFRLCVPFSFKSLLSPFNIAKSEVSNTQSGKLSYVDEGNISALNTIISSSGNLNNSAKALTLTDILPYIWISVTVVILAISTARYFNLKQKLKSGKNFKENIYFSHQANTPFILGIIKPKIYIPSNTDKQYIDYIIAHEKYHLKRKDHIIKAFAFLLLAIHWFNPFCFIAFKLMNDDMEMSCDEYVLKHSANDIRADYSTLLLDFATKTQAFSAGLLAFGESDTRRRVKNIMRFTTRKKWVGIVAAVVIIITGISCLTNAVNNTETRSNKIAGTSAVKKSKSVSDDKHVIKVGTKNSIPIEAIPENVESSAIPILKKIEQTFPKEVYQEILHKGQIHLKKYKSGEIVCSITNKNIDDTIYLDLYFDGNGVLTNMLNYCKVKKVQNISKRAEVNKVVNFAKTFLNTEVTYSKKKKNNSTDGVTITEGKLPELYQNSNCLSGYKDSLGNIYFYNRDRGMIISFYMDE